MDKLDRLYVLALVAFALAAKFVGIDGEFFALVAALIGLAVGVRLREVVSSPPPP